MGTQWFRNAYLCVELQPDQMQEIPFPLAEVAVNTYAKLTQTSLLAGAVLLGPTALLLRRRQTPSDALRRCCGQFKNKTNWDRWKKKGRREVEEKKHREGGLPSSSPFTGASTTSSPSASFVGFYSSSSSFFDRFNHLCNYCLDYGIALACLVVPFTPLFLYMQHGSLSPCDPRLERRVTNSYHASTSPSAQLSPSIKAILSSSSSPSSSSSSPSSSSSSPSSSSSSPSSSSSSSLANVEQEGSSTPSSSSSSLLSHFLSTFYLAAVSPPPPPSSPFHHYLHLYHLAYQKRYNREDLQLNRFSVAGGLAGGVAGACRGQVCKGAAGGVCVGYALAWTGLRLWGLPSRRGVGLERFGQPTIGGRDCRETVAMQMATEGGGDSGISPKKKGF
eukprot:GHVS01094323.1.p1 GENE.GHVS01094323.1~~GHVS01094323.1.p1  ORF type:complete len:434 (+),score=133.15 GHVS01094323.1:133-1302(+)